MDTLSIADFLISIGVKSAAIHRSFDHFDFSRGARIILVVGPMGSGKTEFVARVWRDAEVAKRKSASVHTHTITAHQADRRDIFIVRHASDRIRFPHNPPHALSFRGGYIDCGDRIAEVADSFALEQLIDAHPQCGLWIIDEVGFYDERMAFVIKKYVQEKELVFICPTLSWNFRNAIFNSTISFLVEYASDVFPLTAYCEHGDCLRNAVYSYRSYRIRRAGEHERTIPALYFDPLIMVGGGEEQSGDYHPNYEARCTQHHFLPGKEYTHMILKPYAQRAMRSDSAPLIRELAAIASHIQNSALHRDLIERYRDDPIKREWALSALSLRSLAERALAYLCSEANLIDTVLIRHIAQQLPLNVQYLQNILSENGASIAW